MTRKGEFIPTYSGREFWPMDPRADEVAIEDIAHALSMQCRFTGHTRMFYSVAEHSLRVAELVPAEDRLWALLHDAPEAYLADLARPIKENTEIGHHYRPVEARMMRAVCQRFGLSFDEPESVTRADKAMLFIESRDLMPAHEAWAKWESFTDGTERPILSTWLPGQIETRFLEAFEEYSR